MPGPQSKVCRQDQPMLLPPDIGDLVPENSLPRVVDMVARSIDRSTLTALHPGGGCPAYDPRMMLKVILLAYAKGIYSSRKIARATREDVGFLWICGMRPIEHSTVSRFRSERMRPVFEEVFSELISLLADMGFVTPDTCFLDGTKIEADANKPSFVWAKSNKRYQGQLRAKAHAHLKAIDALEEQEQEVARRPHAACKLALRRKERLIRLPQREDAPLRLGVTCHDRARLPLDGESLQVPRLLRLPLGGQVPQVQGS